MLGMIKNIFKKPSFVVENTSLIECGICKCVLYNATSLSPCCHVFCAGCISKWYLMKKTCPTCRAQCIDLLDNYVSRQLAQEFIRQNPGKKRCEEDIAEMDKSEMEYLTLYLCRWTPKTLASWEMCALGSWTPYKKICHSYNRTRFQLKRERLQYLREKIHEREGNTSEISSVEEYIHEYKGGVEYMNILNKEAEESDEEEAASSGRVVFRRSLPNGLHITITHQEEGGEQELDDDDDEEESDDDESDESIDEDDDDEEDHGEDMLDNGYDENFDQYENENEEGGQEGEERGGSGQGREIEITLRSHEEIGDEMEQDDQQDNDNNRCDTFNFLFRVNY